MSDIIGYINEFDESTQKNYRLLQLTNTPQGLLSNIPKFMKSLENDKSYRKAYNLVNKRMTKEDDELQNQKKIVVEWMKNRLEDLRKADCSSLPHVKKMIDIAGGVLSGRLYEICSAGYAYVLKEHFRAACSAVAIYGTSLHFEKWLKVRTNEFVSIDLEPKVVDSDFDQVINEFSDTGKQIKEHFGHGFINARIQRGIISKEPGFLLPEIIVPDRYAIIWGEVDFIQYPEALENWVQTGDLKRWNIQLDQKAECNLRYLLHLCHFENLKPIDTFLLPVPQSIYEADALCNQQLLQLYLSGFKTDDWSKAPASRDDIMSKVNRLLAHLQIENVNELINIRGPHSNKEDARKFVKNTLNHIWISFEAKGEKPRNYDELRLIVFRALQKAPMNIQKAASTRLIKEELSKFAKSKEWRPARGKDKSKRHVA